MCGRLRPQLLFTKAERFYIQNEVHSRPQEMSAVGLGYDCIYRLQSIVRQFQVIDLHNNWNLRLDPLDLGREDRSIQKVHLMLEHNGIHGGPRHKKPQSIGTVVSVY
jgi:hypothetical protein